MKNKFGGFLLRCAVVLLTVILIECLLSYSMVPGISYVRTQMHDFYAQKNIDVLFLGSSHVYRGVDTKIIDDATNLNSFNLGTSSQKVIDSYFLLREAADNYQLKQATLDIDFASYVSSGYAGQTKSSLLIIDRMKNNANKFKYITSAFDLDEYIFVLCKSSHYVENSSILSMYSNLKYKATEEYKNFTPPFYHNEHYASKGFVPSSGFFKATETTAAPYVWDEKSIDATAIEYLQKSIDFCKSRNIELLLISTPVTDFTISSVGDYNAAHEYFDNIAKTNSIEYYDFNYNVSEEDKFGDELFTDAVHLNAKGAEKLSLMLSEKLISSMG